MTTDKALHVVELYLALGDWWVDIPEGFLDSPHTKISRLFLYLFRPHSENEQWVQQVLSIFRKAPLGSMLFQMIRNVTLERENSSSRNPLANYKEQFKEIGLTRFYELLDSGEFLKIPMLPSVCYGVKEWLSNDDELKRLIATQLPDKDALLEFMKAFSSYSTQNGIKVHKLYDDTLNRFVDVEAYKDTILEISGFSTLEEQYKSAFKILVKGIHDPSFRKSRWMD